MEKPLIVHKEAGTGKVGDLPAKDELDDSGKKKLQLLDVIMNHKGKFDFKEIEKLFLQQRYADLPDPLGGFDIPTPGAPNPKACLIQASTCLGFRV